MGGKYIDVYSHHVPYLEHSILFFIITCPKKTYHPSTDLHPLCGQSSAPMYGNKRVKLSPSITMDDATKGSKSCRDLQSTPHKIKKLSFLQAQKEGKKKKKKKKKIKDTPRPYAVPA